MQHMINATNEIDGEIASEVSTGTSSATGKRVSKTSDWSVFTVPVGHAINKEKTEVETICARESEHTYKVEYVEYDDYVELIPGIGIKCPRTIRVRTHARSSRGPYGGGGGMKIRVKFEYVKYNSLTSDESVMC